MDEIYLSLQGKLASLSQHLQDFSIHKDDVVKLKNELESVLNALSEVRERIDTTDSSQR